jgi:acyl-CoA thioesterase FadM
MTSSPLGMILPETVRDTDFEHNLAAGPFIHNINVTWGDCDPAQIAYTGNIPSWGLDAIEKWYKACTGHDWYGLNLDLCISTPFVHLSCDFKSPITPREDLSCHVYITRMGNASLAHYVEGRQGDRLCFTGNYICAFANAREMKTIRIPDRIRGNIERFADHQGRDWERASRSSKG